MSDTDSFIDEVTEEVRRDQLFATMKKYALIPVLLIVTIVGGAAWSEYQKAQTKAAAEQLGDDIIAALADNEPADRATALSKITATTAGGAAIVQLLTSAAQANSGDTEQARTGLETVAQIGETAEIYRQIATFKTLTMADNGLSADERRVQFEAMAQPGSLLRLLAEEQLALIDLSEGQTDAAISRLQTILQDAEVSNDLQRRVSQVIVALGETPDLLPGSRG